MKRTYRVTTSPIYENTKYQPQKGCNAILFRNPGDTDAMINGEILAAGATYTIVNNGLEGEVDLTTYDIKFVNTPGTAPQVIVREKIYDL